MQKVFFSGFVVLLSINVFAQSFDSFYDEGIQLYKQKKYEASIVKFDQCLNSQAVYFNAYLKKSYAFYYIEEYKKALETIEKGFDFEPIDQRYFYMKAQFYDKLKNFDLALHYINLAIKFQNHNTSYYNFRADLKLELGLYKEAISDYDYILSVEPDNYNLYFNRGLAEYNLKNKINACLDWAYAQEKNKNCKEFLFYKCSGVDLRAYNYKEANLSKITEPLFVCNEDSSLITFLKRSYYYPEKAFKNGEQGTVVIQFTIDSQGKLLNQNILNSVSPTLDSVALNMVSETAEFWQQPALKNGVPIEFNYILPVNFRIFESSFTETNLLDSIKLASSSGNMLTELNFISEYLKMNPFNFEIAQRKKVISNELKLQITNNNVLDYNAINGKIIEEIRGYSNVYKLWFNADWEISDVKNASYYLFSTYYPLTKGLNSEIKVYRIDGTPYFNGGLYQGRLQGNFTEFYSNGGVNCEFIFNAGVPLNQIKYYYPNGVLKHQIYCDPEGFSIIQYNGSAGNSLIIEPSFVWEFSNKGKSANDTVQIVVNVDFKKEESNWRLYFGTELIFDEYYKKNRFVSGFEYTKNGKISYHQTNITSIYLVPYAYLKLDKMTLSPSLPIDNKVLIYSFNPDLESPHIQK